MPGTSETLLGRLKVENAQEAWRDFYHLYWAVILSYGRKLGLNRQEAEEVLQETMVVLMRILPTFAYDPKKGSFRNFLLTIVHRKSLAIIRRRQRHPTVSLLSDDPLERLQAGDTRSVDTENVTRWREALVEEALRQLREYSRLDQTTYAVFKAYVLEKRPVEEVTRMFGISDNAVYQVRNRVIKRLKMEVAKLMKESGSDAPEL